MFAYFLLKCIMIVLIQRIKCAGEFKCKKGCENCVGKIVFRNLYLVKLCRIYRCFYLK